MAKKRLTRQQKKQRRGKGKSFRQRGRSRTAVLPPIELDPADTEAIAPLMTGSDAQMMKNMMDALYDSGKWADEPELAEILFDPQMCMAMFIKTAEEMGYSPDSFFDLKGAAFEDAFFDIATVILPVLLTEEIRQEVVTGLTELGQRYKGRFQQRKAAQVAFVKLLLANEEQKPTWPQINLLQAIVSRSMDAGFQMFGLIEEVQQAGDDLFDENGNLKESASVSRLTKMLEKVPGMDRILDKQMDELWEDAEKAAFEGTLHFGLYTDAELEQADAILAAHLEPSRAAGIEGIPDEVVPTMLSAVDDYLVQLLTPERLAQMQQRLSQVVREKRLEPQWIGLATMLRDYLGEENAAETERPFLFRALMGELRMASQLEEEE